ncbi:MAG: hypothetical protein ACRDRI_16695 [Pseudonocardiaceae bacterium]
MAGAGFVSAANPLRVDTEEVQLERPRERSAGGTISRQVVHHLVSTA